MVPTGARPVPLGLALRSVTRVHPVRPMCILVSIRLDAPRATECAQTKIAQEYNNNIYIRSMVDSVLVVSRRLHTGGVLPQRLEPCQVGRRQDGFETGR
jgi:hypothetical protein